MLWAVLVGTSLGYKIAGGVGAATGFGYGSLVELVERVGLSRMPDPIGLQVEWVADDAGLSFTVTSRETLADGTAVLIQVFDGEKPLVASAEPYADANAHFGAVGRFVSGTARLYVPFGAMEYAAAGEFTVHVTAVENPDAKPRVRGKRAMPVPFAAPRPFAWGDVLRPIIGLAMRVARADLDLDRTEVAELRVWLESRLGLTKSDISSLNMVVKTEPSAKVPELVKRVRVRLPNLTQDDLLTFLAAVARADGVVKPVEVAVIQEVAQCFEVTGVRWDRLRRGLGLA